MTQNRSNAVMATRVEAHDSLDYFPTPPFATRALCEWLVSIGEPVSELTVWDPACGECDMVRPLAEYFKWVFASDIKDYSEYRGKEQQRVSDFLIEWAHPPSFAEHPRDWICANPPFRLADQFALMAIRHARRGTALLVRTTFLEGGTSDGNRYRTLFSVSPPSDVLQFCERVPMFKGRLDRNGSTATAYCWLVFRIGAAAGTRFHWIAPCRERLERDWDYPADTAEVCDLPLFGEVVG